MSPTCTGSLGQPVGEDGQPLLRNKGLLNRLGAQIDHLYQHLRTYATQLLVQRTGLHGEGLINKNRIDITKQLQERTL